ncbi:MAG: hypothetical protein SPL30_10265 [Succinivibrio sp.]|jgi:hypothetical protein|nr:hypothetical protein [Succinivibrio sp.]
MKHPVKILSCAAAMAAALFAGAAAHAESAAVQEARPLINCDDQDTEKCRDLKAREQREGAKDQQGRPQRHEGRPDGKRPPKPEGANGDKRMGPPPADGKGGPGFDKAQDGDRRMGPPPADGKRPEKRERPRFEDEEE